MLTVKRLYELLAPYRNHPDMRILRVDTGSATVVVQPEKPLDESITEVVETVIQLAASVWRVTPENILSRRRPMEYVNPRMAVCKVLQDIVGLSDMVASRHLQRVRTAVSYLTGQANKALDTDMDFRVLYGRFERMVKETIYEQNEIQWQSGDH